MAQYFYDFKDTPPKKDAAPNGLENNILGALNSNFTMEYSRTPNGLMRWLKNSDGNTGDFTITASLGITSGPTAADCECLVKLVAHQYNGASYTNDGPTFYARTQSDGTTYSDGYEISLPGVISSLTTFIRRREASVSTTLASGGTSGIGRDVPVWLRFGVSGSTIRLKVWEDGDPEPGTWSQEVTDTNVTAAGEFFFGIPGASGEGYGAAAGTKYELFQLSFGTDGDSAPSSATKTVQGVLLTPAAAAADGYTVRCYHRETGELLGETLSNASGGFSFTVATTEEVYCLAVDQLGDAWNAPIKDLIVPD